MAWLVKLLFSFSGRIGRRDFWIGLLLLVVIMVAGLLTFDPDMLTREGAETPRKMSLLILDVVLFLLTATITIKRLNDRDWPAWLGPLACAIWLPMSVGEQLGLLTSREWGDFVAGNWTGTSVYLLVATVTMIVALVDNAFVRGTVGPNRYGPDPLAQRDA
jgi:uncharacterized membrane protein YhaH (DUF805 family)